MLRKGIPEIDGATLRLIAPPLRGQAATKQSAIIEAIAPELGKTLLGYEISTSLRAAHFLTQLILESHGLTTTESGSNYFRSMYEGRIDLGNNQPGDSLRYKERGLIRIAGRARYKQLGKRLGIPLENDPRLAADPLTALLIACECWALEKLNEAADRDDLLDISRAIAGSTQGLERKRETLEKAKAVLQALG